MAIKSFNVEASTYNKFSKYCKDLGISMSKQVDTFIKSQVEEEPELREEYLAKLMQIRKGKFTEVKGSLMDRY